MLWPLIALTIGIIIQSKLFESQFYVVIASVFLVISIIAAISLHSIKSTGKSLNSIRTTTFILCFLLLGYWLSGISDIRNHKIWYGHHLKNTSALLLNVSEPPQIKQKIVKVTCDVKGVKINENWLETNGTINVNFYKNTYTDTLHLGQRIIIPNQIDRIRNSNNPFAFKYADYLARQNIYHQIFLPQEYAYIFSMPIEGNPHFFDATRKKINEIINRNVTDSTTASLMHATIINERAQLDPDLWKVYSKTGVAHIIAISGMHISIFFLLIYGLFYWIKHRKYLWIRYAVAVPLVWAYVAVTGFPPSAVRAGVMFSFMSFAVFSSRKTSNLNILFATAFVLLCALPQWVFDVGFQLSFLSVLSIMIFYNKIYQWWQPKNKILLYLWQVAAVSCAVQILLWPLIIYYFNQIPVWTIFANIPASVFSLLFMSGSLLLIIFGAIGWDMTWLGDILAYLTDLFHKLLYFFAGISPESLYQLYLDEMDFWLVTISVVLFSIFWMTKKKWSIYGGFITLIVFIISVAMQGITAMQQQRLIIFQTNNKTLIAQLSGKTATLFTTAPLNSADSIYTIIPANMGYRITQTNMSNDRNFWVIDGKKIGYLNGRLSDSASMPLDYLIIGDGATFQPDVWMKNFRPNQIIISQSLKRYKAMSWSSQLNELGINHWNMYEDGAFVLSK